jgi:uncharacterized protein (TIGR00375 family)
MRFFADLHVHSKYSRATSRDLDLEHLAWWAATKGIAVVATGDCVHPAWLAELKAKLVPAEPGLFRLLPEIEAGIARTLPASCDARVRFMLAVEISTIYKKYDRTRKVHHLIYAPDFETVDRLAAKLGAIGNIASDGRPILGLDSRDLLEIALGSGPDAYLIPAHIWTPWFSTLGSQSGFDSIAECYGDLADQIFAVETGLSSDPSMNWRVSFLDRFRLTSNSDAHSPGKLGREATVFDCEPDYYAIRRALETGQGYAGTVEFFPEEGKYHLDGHRGCGVRLHPRETLAQGGRCPACGKPLTVGVAHRVEVLADRGEDAAVPPATAGTVWSYVPLPEILGELAGTGPSSKTVERGYARLISSVGPELFLLGSAPVEHITRNGSELLGEAIVRLRAGEVTRQPGYDGEYGVIRLFDDAELRRLRAGSVLFDALPAGLAGANNADGRRKRPPPDATATSRNTGHASFASPGGGALSDPPPLRRPAPGAPSLDVVSKASGILAHLDEDQRTAAAHVAGPLLIIAGPGSGKTRTLTRRIAHLVGECGVPASNCLAITFSRRAAGELRERLADLMPAQVAALTVHTFHSLGLALLREHGSRVGIAPDFRVAGEAERAAALAEALGLSGRKIETLLRAISRSKRSAAPPEPELADALAAYQHLLAGRNWIDFDDLVGRSVDLLAGEPAIAASCRDRFRFISVDEFQDVDAQQYRLLTLLVPPDGNLCAIGDPDQAIYGFRGADASCFDRFRDNYPRATCVALRRNYRSSGTIVTASSQIIAPSREDRDLATVVRDMQDRITVHAARTEAAEAEFVVATIERLIGGHSFYSLDTGRAGNGDAIPLSFADFAVLYRTELQSAALSEALSRSGIPFKTSSHELLSSKPAVQEVMRAFVGQDRGGPLADRVRAAVQSVETRGEADAAALAQARQWLEPLATTHQDDDSFTAAVALASVSDFFDPRADRVSLLTMHAAKGLEFPVVFIVGLEDGLMPLHWSKPDPAQLAEERRLLYVAMTRARDRLFLSRSMERRLRGTVRTREPSRFLRDIEAELLVAHDAERTVRPPAQRQLELF